MIIRIIDGLITKILSYKMSLSYYAQPDSHIKSKRKGELDLFNYATKSDVGKVIVVDTSEFPEKVDFVSLNKFQFPIYNLVML